MRRGAVVLVVVLRIILRIFQRNSFNSWKCALLKVTALILIPVIVKVTLIEMEMQMSDCKSNLKDLTF